MKKLLLIIFSTLLFGSLAQATDKLFEKWRWRVFTPQNGLPDRNFSLFLQTRNTLYYGVSGRRVFQYDGYVWEELPFQSGHGPVSPITTLVEGRQGLLFAATKNKIWVFQLGSVFKQIYEGEELLLASSSEQRIYFLERGRLYRITGSRIHPFQSVRPVPAETINCMAVDDKEIIWVGTDKGLFSQERYGWKKEETLAAAGAPSPGVLNLFVTRSRHLWVETESRETGIMLHERTGGTWRPPYRNAPTARVLSLSGYADGVMYAFTEKGGAYRLIDRSKGWKKFPTIQPGSPVTVSSMIDNRQALWMCFRSIGIARFDSRSNRWKSPAAVADEPKESVMSLLCARDGTIWAGTLDSLVRFRGEKAEPITETAGYRLHTITGLAEDADGRIWASSPTAFPGALIFDNTQQLWSRWLLPSPDGESIYFEKIYVDGTGTIWLLSPERGGLWRLHNGIPEHFGIHEELSGRIIHDMLVGSKGHLWFATDAHLIRLRKTGAVYSAYHLTRETGLAFNRVWDIEEGQDGSIWIAYQTGGGISRWRNGAFTHYTTENGLANENVWSIKSMQNGDVWFGTQSGISCYDGSAFYNYEVGEDPLLSNVRPIAQSVNSDSIILGTLANGVFEFQRNDHDIPRVFPLQNPRSFAFSEPVRLSWEGIDRFHQTPRNSLLYILKLDGLQWSLPQLKTSFVEKYLSPGEHTLNIQARDLDGNQARVPLTITFRVELPWHKSPEIILGASVLMLILLTLAASTVRLRWLAGRNAQLFERLVNASGRTVVLVNRKGRILYSTEPPLHPLAKNRLLSETHTGRRLQGIDPGKTGTFTSDQAVWKVTSLARGAPRGWLLSRIREPEFVAVPREVMEQAESLVQSIIPETDQTYFSIPEAIDGIIGTYSKTLQARITPTIPVPSILWKAQGARADFEKIVSIFIDNALESTPSGAVTVLAQNKRLHKEHTHAPAVEIEILDEGAGLNVSSAEACSLFYTTKEKNSHQGLGLSIALALAKRNSALIALEHREETGLRARLLFPAVRTTPRR